MTDRNPRVALSVVMVSPDSFETIRTTVAALQRQTVKERLEVIVIGPETVEADLDREAFAEFAASRLATEQPHWRKSPTHETAEGSTWIAPEALLHGSPPSTGHDHSKVDLEGSGHAPTLTLFDGLADPMEALGPGHFRQ